MKNININEDAVQVQIVINTLESMNIPATFDNVNKLTGIYQLLFGLKEKLDAAAEAVSAETDPGLPAPVQEEEKDGKT